MQQVSVSMSLAAAEDEREEMAVEITRNLRRMQDGVFKGFVHGSYDYCAVLHFSAAVEADDQAVAEEIASDYLARAALDAGYEVKPGWFVQLPVSEEAQREINERVEAFFSQAAA